DVHLVGHSFGGCYLPRVAVAAPERLRHLVWLDATVLEEGEAFFQTLPFNRSAESCQRLAQRVRSGQSPLAVELIEVPRAELPGAAPPSSPVWTFDRSRQSLQPTLTMAEPLEAPGFENLKLPNTFIYCTWNPTIRHVFNYERARQRGYSIIEVDADHGITQTNPKLLVETLHALTTMAE